MQITERKEGPILVLALDGRLDHSGAGIFQECAVNHIKAGARSMVVDFGGTNFVASMGIRAIMVPAQEISREGGRFAVAGLSSQVVRLFEISGLLQVFKVYDTVADAAADGIWN
jgi:anti-anti-sigma factor